MLGATRLAEVAKILYQYQRHLLISLTIINMLTVLDTLHQWIPQSTLLSG